MIFNFYYQEISIGIDTELSSSQGSFSQDESLYVPTPLKQVSPVVVPDRIAVVSITQLSKFVESINQIRSCTTPGCDGVLAPISVCLERVGGTVNISYVCNGCGIHKVMFKGSDINDSLNKTDVGASIMVAFIISGCLFSTYHKVMKLSLGIDVYKFYALHPIIKNMLDHMCEEAKEDETRYSRFMETSSDIC